MYVLRLQETMVSCLMLLQLGLHNRLLLVIVGMSVERYATMSWIVVGSNTFCRGVLSLTEVGKAAHRVLHARLQTIEVVIIMEGLTTGLRSCLGSCIGGDLESAWCCSSMTLDYSFYGKMEISKKVHIYDGVKLIRGMYYFILVQDARFAFIMICDRSLYPWATTNQLTVLIHRQPALFALDWNGWF
ncbi:hypothetical protein H5410_059634 [Solanum commersonii]|uniref:Uncharacterized protein n=1 Tax=Solanum commersonii TaxID=4109 RepID=A0A9J5W3K5_SOLCO|nr:hypothetical protein H5410_059634 [Solanum commersonii]